MSGGLSWRYGCWYYHGKEVSDALVGQLVADLEAESDSALSALRDLEGQVKAIKALPNLGTTARKLDTLLINVNGYIVDLLERRTKRG